MTNQWKNRPSDVQPADLLRDQWIEWVGCSGPEPPWVSVPWPALVSGQTASQVQDIQVRYLSIYLSTYPHIDLPIYLSIYLSRYGSADPDLTREYDSDVELTMSRVTYVHTQRFLATVLDFVNSFMQLQDTMNTFRYTGGGVREGRNLENAHAQPSEWWQSHRKKAFSYNHATSLGDSY